MIYSELTVPIGPIKIGQPLKLAKVRLSRFRLGSNTVCGGIHGRYAWPKTGSVDGDGKQILREATAQDFKLFRMEGSPRRTYYSNGVLVFERYYVVIVSRVEMLEPVDNYSIS